jgi:plasmid stabilization system protein ParE
MTQSKFRLTRRAATDLRDIYDLSVERWGVKTARSYIDKLYAAMRSLKAKDDRAKQRKERSIPFSMIPVEKHFIVYEIIDKTPLVITILHQRRNIETIIRNFTPEVLAEIEALRDKGL